MSSPPSRPDHLPSEVFHDLKGALQALVGRLDLLLIRPDLGPIARLDAEKALAAAHALNELLETRRGD